MASCNPVKRQLIRGIVGIGLLVAAGFAFKVSLALSVFLVALSLFPLRGCPACWALETCEAIDKAHHKKNQEITLQEMQKARTGDSVANPRPDPAMRQ